jgi:hypothetical protein
VWKIAEYIKINKYPLLLLLLFLVIFSFFNRDEYRRLNYDGIGYYSYLRSLFFDHDLQFANEYNELGYFKVETYPQEKTSTDYYPNPWSVGPAVLWLPFMIMAHLLALLFNLFGHAIPLDGYNPLYTGLVGISTALYGFLGFYLVYLVLKRYFSPLISFITTGTMLLTSPILWYMFRQPFYAHALSFFAVSLFVFYWLRMKEKGRYIDWITLGLLAGLMSLTRWSNGVFLVIPIAGSLIAHYIIPGKKGEKKAKLSSLLLKYLIFILMFFAAFSPQLICWKIIYGSAFTIPQGSAYVHWSHPFISELLFSSRHGLFSWSPIIYLAVIGLFFFLKKDLPFGLIIWASLVLIIYVNSVAGTWWGEGSFGMRRFCCCLLFFSLGLAALLERLIKRPLLVVSLLLGFFVIWNLLFLEQFNKTMISSIDPVPFQIIGENQARLLFDRVGNPFSFPANLFFSLKYKLPLNSYDYIEGNYLFYNYYYHKISDRYTLEFDGREKGIQLSRDWGWSRYEASDELTFRWAERTDARIYVLLNEIDFKAVRMDMRVFPFFYPGSGNQTMKLSINGNLVNSFVLPNEARYQEISTIIDASLWKEKVNEIRFDFSFAEIPRNVFSNNPPTNEEERIIFEALGRQDNRRFAAAFDYIRFFKIK